MSSPADLPSSDQLPAAENLRRADASMRRVRRLGIGFVVLQFGLYQAPPGIEVPFARWPVALLLAGALLCIDLVAAQCSVRMRAPSLHRLGLAQWAIDGATVLGIVWLFSFDPTSALWALLVIPVLEGALRLQMRGAMLAWSVLGAGYIVREAWAAATYPQAEFTPESVTYRLGIVLMVAVCAGGLARNLQQQIEAHATARRIAIRRAEVLAVVAAAGRRLSMTVEEILTGVVEATQKLGFDGVEVCVLDDDHRTYSVRSAEGLPVFYERERHAADTGIAGEAIARGGTVVVPDYANWSAGVRAARDAGFGMVIAVPVFCSGEIAGVLVAGYLSERRATSDEVDGLELLAAHAGAALEQQQRFAERTSYEERLNHQAYHDAVTGLPNRLLFSQRLEEAVLAARWEQTDVAVLSLDFNHFQAVNDSLGHEAGDLLLAGIGGQLSAALAPGEVLARVGGAEFVILLQGADVRGRAPRMARGLLALLHEPREVRGRMVYLSASIGIAYGPVASAPSGELLRRALLATDHAKELGRDRVAVYRPDMGDRPLERLETEAALRAALERDEFVLHYQPIHNLGTGVLEGVEALVRWQRDGELVQPGAFLPAAEETGLIVPLGSWVLREAVAQHGRWLDQHGVALPIFVNVSGQQLRQPHFVTEVQSILRRSGMAPGLLVLEITEGGLTSEDGSLARLVGLRELGVRLALDDFGTGWSSLSRLRGLPVDILKVDRSFVARLPGDPRSEAIVRSVVALAAELGMSVTAEGVEHEGQRAAVTRLGCNAVQGYLLGRPQEPGRIAQLFATAAAGRALSH
jgi:diguanylate cyclase (GGDEF)-like protein